MHTCLQIMSMDEVPWSNLFGVIGEQDLWRAHAVDPRHPLIIDALDECREEMRLEGSDGR